MAPHVLCSIGPAGVRSRRYHELSRIAQFTVCSSLPQADERSFLRFENGDYLIFLGYAYDRNFQLLRTKSHFAEFLACMAREPEMLHRNYDGSYVSILYEAMTHNIFIASDRVGFKHLYFSHQNGTSYLCTRMKDLGRILSLEVDKVGVLEYSVLRSCLAERTLFHGCFRIPPGFIGRIDRGTLKGKVFVPYYVKTPKEADDDAVEMFYHLHKQIAGAFKPLAASCSLGLSSGWDSRLILSGIMDCDYTVDTFTTGTPGDYEVRIAQRIAEAARCPWSLIDISGNYIPDPEVFCRTVDDCEAGQHTRWPNTRDHLKNFDYMFIGDLLEAFQTRASSLLSKKARIRYFLRSALGNRAIQRLRDKHDWFISQADAIVAKIAGVLARVEGEAPAHPQVSESFLREAVRHDVETIEKWAEGSFFETVGSIEEFWHYTINVRAVHGDQLRQIASCGPEGAAITTTAWMAEETTRIPIPSKLNNQLRYRVIRCCPHRSLREIPSYDVPWISAEWPNAVRVLIQGARSLSDSILHRMHTRNRKWPETILKHHAITKELIKGLETVRRYPAQGSWEMRSWVQHLQNIEAGKELGYVPMIWLGYATILRLLSDEP